MQNRAEIVAGNFTRFVLSGDLPEPAARLTPAAAGLTREAFLDLFESQIISRHLDLAARALRARGEGFYTIGGSGHEGNAAFGMAFRHTDIAFLHYRAGAMFAQRAKQLPGATAAWDVLLGLVASAEDPISGGRHKVFGSRDLWVPPQTSTIASHVPKAVGAAMAIDRARDLDLPRELPDDAVAFCSFGDASANHATALAGLNAAAYAAHRNIPLPLCFLCEDNGFGISVRSPEGWIEATYGRREGLHYIACDGLSLPDAWRAAREAEAYVRERRRPVFVHMRTVRLMGHAGSDMQTNYQSPREIEAAERRDPLLHSARIAIEEGYLSADGVLEIYETTRERIARMAAEVTARPKLVTAAQVMASLAPERDDTPPAPRPASAARAAIFRGEERHMAEPQHMARLINWALADVMLRYPQAAVFGEDVARAGGVYHVTAGLLKKFGPRRVYNTPLDETTILGAAIGMAQCGFLPIPEIQFLAYVHNAEDQLRGEAATLSFFSDGQFTNPMVVRIAGLAYQKGFGGHFHNDNSLAVFRDVPGLIVACPSNGRDAAGMLRACVAAAHEQRRVCVFIEPIALYMTKDLHEPGDGGWQFEYPEPEFEIPVGEIGVWGESDELAIVTYGNGYFLSRQAAGVLAARYGVEPKIIDLRWIAPLNEAAIAREVAECRHVLVVDECRRTGSQSEAIVTALVERCDPAPRIARVTARDSFVPLAEAANLVLPSRDEIVRACVALAGLTERKPVGAGRAK